MVGIDYNYQEHFRWSFISNFYIKKKNFPYGQHQP